MLHKIIIALTSVVIAPLLIADEVKIEIGGDDQMQFDVKAFEVVEGQQVTLTLTHTGQLPKIAMGHNVVILKPGTDLTAFAMKAAMKADNEYLPDDEESKKLIVAATKMLGGGEKDTISFTAPAPGEYPYFCSFPGHFAMMQGVMTVKPKP